MAVTQQQLARRNYNDRTLHLMVIQMIQTQPREHLNRHKEQIMMKNLLVVILI
jgi:hypothetical protein